MHQDVLIATLGVGDDAEQAAQPVEDEGAEIGCERDGEQRVGQRGHLVVGGIAEAGEDAMWQSRDGGVRRSSGIAESQRYSNDANDG